MAPALGVAAVLVAVLAALLLGLVSSGRHLRSWTPSWAWALCYGSSRQSAAAGEPLAQVHVMPGVASAALCGAIIDQAETQPWSTARHATYPTTDIATHVCPELEQLLLSVDQVLRDAGCRLFGFLPGQLWLRDQFVVKYAGEGQRSLEAHRDASSVSYVLALNGKDEYEGGGTAFIDGLPASKTAHRLDTGAAILFCGKRLHEGLPVTRGTRYIVTGFLDAHADPVTAQAIYERNLASRGDLVRGLDLRPMVPTRPYLRSNTYRYLGRSAARQGDASSMTDARTAQERWPHAELKSLTEAARKLVSRHGRQVGERALHERLWHFLTSPAECRSTYCHMSS